MASTGAIFPLRLRPAVTTKASRVTGAVFPLVLRALSGAASSGVVPSRDLTNLQNALPHASVKFLNPDGTVATPWRRYIQLQHDVFLAGLGVYTFEDLQVAIDRSIARLEQQSQQVSTLQQVTETNAAALSATVQVAQQNSLAGANQIPPVRTSAQEMIP